MSSKAGGYVPFNSRSPTQVVDWRSHTGSPEVLTITLLPIIGWEDPPDPTGLQYPTLPGLLTSLSPMRAIITWANGGESSNEVVCDYPWRGGTLTVTASTVAVSFVPDQIAGVSPPITYEQMRGGAFVSRGASRQQDITPLTYTDDFYITNPTPGIPIPTPRYARAYWVEDDGTPAAPGVRAWTVTWQNRGPPGPDPGVLQSVLRVDLQYINADFGRSAPSAGKPMPIPSRATHVTLVHGAIGGPMVRQAIVYILDVGA